MGLDAFVYCNCFKEGKTTEPPLDKSLIVIDEEGFYNLNIPESEETFPLYQDLTEWMKICCKHKDMLYAYERVGSWSMVAFFKGILINIGEKHLPILLNSTPTGNEGIFPAKLATKALVELNYLKRNIRSCTGTFLIDEKRDEELYYHIGSYGSEFFWNGEEKISFGLDEQGFFISDDDNKTEVFRSMHFSIKRKSDIKSSQEIVYEFYDFDKKIKAEVNNTIGTVDMPAELRVVNRKLKVKDIGFIIQSLKKLMKASIKTGNPIVWT